MTELLSSSRSDWDEPKTLWNIWRSVTKQKLQEKLNRHKANHHCNIKVLILKQRTRSFMSNIGFDAKLFDIYNIQRWIGQYLLYIKKEECKGWALWSDSFVETDN